MDVLLNLRNPLAKDGEQLRDGGTRVPEDLSALRLTGVKEGELCGKTAETKVYCNANQIDRRHQGKAATHARHGVVYKAYHIKFPQQAQ